ncbi:hypothetical protein M8R20_05515 [Pseudomonas sp. R2.Fl]|nr:hypothetical protein [Pseudomonas sp. R2.Fl]
MLANDMAIPSPVLTGFFFEKSASGIIGVGLLKLLVSNVPGTIPDRFYSAFTLQNPCQLIFREIPRGFRRTD